LFSFLNDKLLNFLPGNGKPLLVKARLFCFVKQSNSGIFYRNAAMSCGIKKGLI
jgi:hypothetical protein